MTGPTPIYDDLVARFPAASLSKPEQDPEQSLAFEAEGGVAKEGETDTADQVASNLDAAEQDGGQPEVDEPTGKPAAMTADSMKPAIATDSEASTRGMEWAYEDLAPLTAERTDGDEAETVQLPRSAEAATCYWCGVAIPQQADSHAMAANDPVGGDELILTACSNDHAQYLREHYHRAS